MKTYYILLGSVLLYTKSPIQTYLVTQRQMANSPAGTLAQNLLLSLSFFLVCYYLESTL